MKQIRLFSETGHVELEHSVNKFLAEIGPENPIKSIRYNAAPFEFASTGNLWTAMVVYEKEETKDVEEETVSPLVEGTSSITPLKLATSKALADYIKELNEKYPHLSTEEFRLKVDKWIENNTDKL